MENGEEEKSMRLPSSFFLNDDVVSLGQELLGMRLFTCIDGHVTGGEICETESYKGAEDRASHAYNNRRTKRTEVMFHAGGICYVYLCYGIHHLLNIVTNKEGIPHAILIRSLRPLVGMEYMLERRNKKKVTPSLTHGPGSVAKALGVTLKHNAESLDGNTIWIEKGPPKTQTIKADRRIGIDYAGPDALLPWRFTLI